MSVLYNIGNKSDIPFQSCQGLPSKEVPRPRTKIKVQSFEVCLEKKCIVSKIKNIVKSLICTEKNVSYTKGALYQMYAKLRFKLQRQTKSKFVSKSGKGALNGRVRYIKGPLY